MRSYNFKICQELLMEVLLEPLEDLRINLRIKVVANKMSYNFYSGYSARVYQTLLEPL